MDCDQKADYVAAWDKVFSQLSNAEKSLLLRDVHSPNILWRNNETGTNRVGLIDFQDAMIGPSAYDVASLIFDARVTIATGTCRIICSPPISTNGDRLMPDFDEECFRRAFAIMAAQRNAKILGIFVRLDERDGKPFYLQHLPRIRPTSIASSFILHWRRSRNGAKRQES